MSVSRESSNRDESGAATLRREPPKTVVTMVVAIDHPEWVGDGDDEKIALEALRRDVRHEDRLVRIVDVETIPGERG